MPVPDQMYVTMASTIVEGQDFVGRHMDFEQGCICPVCQRFAKRHPRKITSSMAVGLGILAYYQRQLEVSYPLGDLPRDVSRWARRDTGGSIWLHKDRLFVRLQVPTGIRGDVSKFKYWGMLQDAVAVPNLFSDLSTQARKGFARVTAYGLLFVGGTVRVMSRCAVYDDTPYWEAAGEMVTFEQAVRSENRFNYDELMRGRVVEMDVPSADLWHARSRYAGGAAARRRHAPPAPGQMMYATGDNQ